MPLTLPQTDVELVNLALGNLQHTIEVQNLETDNTVEAKAARRHYELVRRRCLRLLDWPFARKRAVVAQALEVDGVTPIERDGWSYCYELPDDCLTARRIFPGVRQVNPQDELAFDQELDDAGTGGLLLCDVRPSTETPVLVYTRDVTTPTQLSPEFVDFFAWALAAELALPVTKKRELRETALLEARRAFAEAALAAASSRREPRPPTTPSVLARR